MLFVYTTDSQAVELELLLARPISQTLDESSVSLSVINDAVISSLTLRLAHDHILSGNAHVLSILRPRPCGKMPDLDKRPSDYIERGASTVHKAFSIINDHR